MDGSGMPAMLAADAHLEVRARLAPFANGKFHQFSDTLLVQHLSRPSERLLLGRALTGG
jgi:hypothetical protein